MPKLVVLVVVPSGIYSALGFYAWPHNNERRKIFRRKQTREREANISEINEGQVKTNPESVDERLNHLERERDLQLLMACYRNWRATVEFLRIQGGCLEKDSSILTTKGPLIRLPHRLCKTSLSSGAVAMLTKWEGRRRCQH